MAVAMKGLLKGLRFISHIFEEDEPEMQIGVPTDVRHVAHIGWDGPTASAPSWMDKYKGDGESDSPSPAQGSESVDESPSKRRAKVSRSVESEAPPTKQSRRKKKGSSRTSGKLKTGHVDETGSEPDLEGG